MPKEWYDRGSVLKSNISENDKQIYLNIIADKKPYFMIYIYPTLMKQYNTYMKNTNKKCIREFRITIDELLSKQNRTEDEENFIKYYTNRMPVGVGNCVMNRICSKIERIFDNYLKSNHSNDFFDYTMLKYSKEYCSAQYNEITYLYEEYTKRVQDYMQYVSCERIDEDESSAQRSLLVREFKRECSIACPDKQQLCNIILDICYQKNCSKQFAWDICDKEIIESLLQKNNNIIYYPVMDLNGDIEYKGNKFSLHSKILSKEESL